MSIIFNKIEDFYKKQVPFVSYRKPNDTKIAGFFMNDDVIHYTTKFNENGFVFAPFNYNEKAILFPEEFAHFLIEDFLIEEDFIFNNDFKNEHTFEKEKHILLVEKALAEIHKNSLQKVVVSREEYVKLDSFDVLTTFKKLLKTYKNAFVYVWFHPKVGLWFGATPETLVQISNSRFKTMSLAGTQEFFDTKEVIWTTKELEEQQLVTHFIECQLNTIAHELKTDKTETIKAGNLVHLKTKVEGELNKNATLKELLRALHPTPAVCGLPREKAKEFISTNENYKRTFYTGFLGEINLKNHKSSLFVNLRCMQIKDKIASIYVGGGITKESNAKKEWEETVSKSKTIKKIL